VLGAFTIAVHLLDQAVENPNAVAATKKLTRHRTADKPRAAGN
jgi:hypothetical protein